MKIQQPKIIDKIFLQEEFETLQSHAKDLYLNRDYYEEGFGRYIFGKTEILENAHNLLLEKARKIFDSETLLPSWSMMAAYRGDQGSLSRHTDDNACTYHLDISIFQTINWDLWVKHEGEEKPYSLKENQALAMYGEDQEHWREDLKGEPEDVVCNAFFFFCEPDHWYFTKGPEYINVLRGEKNV
jgi:hypothetical protein